MKRYFAIILFAAALASCTPKLYDAQVEVPENYRFAGDFPQDSVSLPFAWWEIFGDSTLNRLVEHALENNRNLAQAASRIFEARANIAVARAPFLPSVGLNLSAQGNYTEPTGTTQQYTIEPSISWEVPLFGTLRSANRAAKAALYSSEWGYRGVMLSLTAEVATSYFTVLQYTRDPADRPAELCAAPGVGGARGFARPLRHVQRRGPSASHEPRLSGRGRYSAVSACPSSSRVWPFVSCSARIPPISGTKLSTMPCWTIIR